MAEFSIESLGRWGVPKHKHKNGLFFFDELNSVARSKIFFGTSKNTILLVK